MFLNIGGRSCSETVTQAAALLPFDPSLPGSQALMLHMMLFFSVVVVVFSQQTHPVTKMNLFSVLLCLAGASRRPCDLAHAEVPANPTSPPGGLRSAHVPAGFGNQHHHVSESRHYRSLSASSV